jgi:RHS repeat-associated protein
MVAADTSGTDQGQWRELHPNHHMDLQRSRAASYHDRELDGSQFDFARDKLCLQLLRLVGYGNRPSWRGHKADLSVLRRCQHDHASLWHLIGAHYHIWTYGEDANGNQVTVSDPRGVVATATYDDLNRPTGVAWDSSGVSGSAVGFVPGARSVSYAWDNCTNGVGKLCSRTDHSGTAAYSYDAWGRLTGQSFVPTGQTAAITTGYGYDAYGRRQSVVYPSGKALTYSYGTNGRISGMSWAGASVIDGMTAQPMGGPVTGWNWSAVGIPSAKAHVGLNYDLDGRLSHVSDVDDIDLIHDLDDKLTGTSYLTQTDKNQVYGYDARHELTSADNALWGGAVTYAYDAAGNRTNKTWNTDQVQQGYDSTNNRLVSVTPVANGVPGTVQTRVFDAMGNTVNDGIGRTYGFDALGRMVSAASSGSSTVFTVGTDGLRKRKVTTGLDATDKIYAYDDQRRLIGVYVPDGLGGFTVSEELVYLGDEWKIAGDVRGQVAGGSDGVFYPVLTDQIGSPRVVLDPSSGASRWEWEAKEAFGYQAPNENPGSVGVFKFDARFPGQWFDTETGLFQNGYRDYDPRTGRYVQSDPIGLGGGWNTYAYVGGQVTGAMDVNGLSITAAPGTDPFGELDMALSYLLLFTPSEAPMIREMINSKYVYSVNMNWSGTGDGGQMNFYDSETRQTTWAPTYGLKYVDGCHVYYRPAALSLLHELKHAYDYYKSARGYTDRQNTPNKIFDDNEEMAATLVENNAARDIGAFQRYSHTIGNGMSRVRMINSYTTDLAK